MKELLLEVRRTKGHVVALEEPQRLGVLGSWHCCSQIMPITVPLLIQEVHPSVVFLINVQQQHCARSPSHARGLGEGCW